MSVQLLTMVLLRARKSHMNGNSSTASFFDAAELCLMNELYLLDTTQMDAEFFRASPTSGAGH